MNTTAPASDIPLCRGCTPLGRCRFGVTSLIMGEDGAAVATLRCGEEQQGGPMVAHGGWTAAVFDDVLGRLPAMYGDSAVTALLEVKFLKPVPVNRDLSLRARIDRRDGRRLYISGALYLAGGDAALADGSGVWVVRRPDHFQRHRQWLAEQDAPG